MGGPFDLGRLEAAWRRSDHLFGLLAPDALRARPIPLRHPLVFYLGHLPAFAWNQICGGVLGEPPLHGRFETLFARGIDPEEGAASGEGAWPERHEIEAYRDRVRDEVRGCVPALRRRAGDELAAHGRVLDLVLEHELMHHETLLYLLQELPAHLKRAPAGHPAPEGGGAAEPGAVRVPAGIARLGSDPATTRFAWDNELPPRHERVPAFVVDRRPVTNQEFVRFVEAGGYARDDLWRAEDRAWRAGRAHPHRWRPADGGWRVRTLFEDVPFERAAGWPAEVTLAEARAYARWRGARLPTEAQWHRAARGDDPGGPLPPGNRGLRRWAPRPAGTEPGDGGPHGVLDLAGNAWEWTDTVFGPFPGFRAHLRTYPGYSADFFDGGHYVLLGGSWATDEGLARPGFRNWFRPRYPWVFAKFRCVHEESI